MKHPNILITGATGFVGRQIFRALDRHSVSLVSVVRSGTSTRLPENTRCLRIIETPDVFGMSEEWWELQCRGVDLVIHAAWYAEPGKYLHSAKNIHCLIGSLRLAQGAANAGVQRFIGIGSCFEYILSDSVLTVDTPLNPTTVYAASKAALFQTLTQWLPRESVSFAWCRLFYLYGDGEDHRRLVPHIRHQLSMGQPAELTSGEQIRDFMDVADAGKVIAQVSLGEVTGAVNVCTGRPTTVRQLAERIADEYGRRDLLHFGVRPNNQFDPPSVIGVPNFV